MAQIKSYAASSLVSGRDANVIVSTGADWSSVLKGAMFMFQGDNVSYFVGSTVAPSVSDSGYWELLLTSEYVGTQKTGASYVIHQDFEANVGLPLMRSGDVETGIIFSRAMQKIGELLVTGLVLEGTYTPAAGNNGYPKDTTPGGDDMSSYTAKRSYWIADTTYTTFTKGAKLIWNGGSSATEANNWYYVEPDVNFYSSDSITTAMLQDEAVTTAKLSTALQDSIEAADALHYKGDFSPSGASYPSTAGLVDYDYFIADDNGTVSGTYYKAGDWARYDQDTGNFGKEAQYSPYGTPYTYMGGWDASGNTAPSSPNEYEAWRITAAGTFGGITWVIDDICVYIDSAWTLYPKTPDLTLYAATTDATQTEMFLADGSSRLVLASDTTWGFDIMVVARRTDADNESAFYRFEGCIDNNAGTTALVGSVVAATPIEDTAAWACSVDADNTNDALRVRVTGEGSKNISWKATVRIVEVRG